MVLHEEQTTHLSHLQLGSPSHHTLNDLDVVVGMHRIITITLNLYRQHFVNPSQEQPMLAGLALHLRAPQTL
jgi:hypothetical protein